MNYSLSPEPINNMPSPNAPLLSDSTFTPEAIQSMIEQLRTKDNITVTEIKDEGDAIRVLGKARINSFPIESDTIQFVTGEVYGILLYMKKAQ